MVYLACHNDNRAETALPEFLGAVDNFGVPSRVPTDQGVENVDIARYMINHPERGEGRGSHITGKSVHSQRIERLWRYVYYACTYKYYALFRFMEDIGILDVEDEVHLFLSSLFHSLEITCQSLPEDGIVTDCQQKETKHQYKFGYRECSTCQTATMRSAREFWEPKTNVSF